MITGIFKIILYAFLAYIFYLLIRFFQAINRRSKSQRKAPNPPSGIMVKDIICNTYLPKEDAIREVYEGKEYFFCSNECRQKFLEQKKPH
jgi:uncharacterized protein